MTHGQRPELGLKHKGIYYGYPTSIIQHSYLVSIHSDDSFICVGTIVSARWLVTLADCEPEVGMYIRAGSSSSMSGGFVFQVDSVTLHPNYVSYTYDYNYACVRINGTFQWSERVNPLNLPKLPPAVNTILSVAGWAYSAIGDVSSLDYELPLMEGSLKWISRKNCRAGWEAYGIPEWTNRMACVLDKSKTSFCNGEWGDSVVKDYEFHGMLAAGSGTCSFSDVPVMVVTIAPVSKWIQNVVGKLDV
ncbi:hypothetical protein J6590_046491 [Homalodisca vitripennis]|nr:hypothetical protein J6590_046491 [Homalodisca vitripennis]